MKYHRQLNKHDPDNGVYGDCFRTVIACLLDLEPLQIPNVMEGMPDNFSELMDNALVAYGVTHCEFPLGYDGEADGAVMAALEFGARLVGNNRYTLCGKSSGGEFDHIVVCKGKEIEHSTNDSTVVGPSIHDGNLWIGFLAKIV